MPTDLSFPTGAVAFPRKCLGCGGVPDRKRVIEARKGFDALYVSYQRIVKTHVPVCQRCARRRFRTALILGFLGVMAIPAMIVLAFTCFTSNLEPLGYVLFVAGLVLLFFMRNRFGPMLDYWIFGVRGLTHSEDATIVHLRFRDDAFASEMRAFNEGFAR